MLSATLVAALALSTQAIPREQRLEWWREARFGLFIHWGLYAIPAGRWGDRTGHGEWIRDTAQIPLDEYARFQPQFNPHRYDPEEWVLAAKNAGMKYIVITTKHHDGFCLFPSQATEWDVANTPYRRDLLAPLAEACRKHGIKLGFYYSIMDWHHPDYLPRRTWETSRPTEGANMGRYVDYMKVQLKEILTNYGDIAVLWFDGEWESTWTEAYGKELYDYCLALQPTIVINNRVTNVRTGMEDLGTERQIGDYSTPEQMIPDQGLPGIDWETCMTMNGHWGYNAADQSWKSSRQLIHNLVDIASKGGNYLLNVGPTAEGEIPAASLERLAEIGAWMKANGESIYGTSGSLIGRPTWGRSTTRTSAGTTTLYMQIFERSSSLRLNGMGSEPVTVKHLASGQPVAWRRDGDALVFDLSSIAPAEETPVLAVTFAGAPKIYEKPTVRVPSRQFVDQARIEVVTPLGLIVRYSSTGEPGADSPVAGGAVTVRNSSTLRFASFDGDRRVSEVVELLLEKVAPWPAASVAPRPGLLVREMAGDFDACPTFPASLPTTTLPTVGLHWDAAREFVAREYTGFIRIPATEMYEFALTSDDGSRLWIDGRLVIDHDGLHSTEMKLGYAPLAEGWHVVRVAWFNKSGGAALGLRFGQVGQPLPRPTAESFGHAP